MLHVCEGGYSTDEFIPKYAVRRWGLIRKVVHSRHDLDLYIHLGGSLLQFLFPGCYDLNDFHPPHQSMKPFLPWSWTTMERTYWKYEPKLSWVNRWINIGWELWSLSLDQVVELCICDVVTSGIQTSLHLKKVCFTKKGSRRKQN